MKTKENYSGFKGTLKFIANTISWTALVLLILVALFLAYYTISNRLAEANGYKKDPFISLYTIISGSMIPNINVYDVVVNKRVDNPNEIKVGDVITFTSTGTLTQGKTITHRVIEVIEKDGKYYYKTQGDNNMTPDASPAEFEYVLGKVIFRIPQLGRIQSFIGTQGGWLVIIVIPALIIIISDILKIFKLTGVKNKIEKMDALEKAHKLERSKREELRKEEIKKHLKLDKNLYEPDPIIVEKNTKVIVADKAPKKITPSKEPLSRVEARQNSRSNTTHKKGKKKKNKR